MTAAPAGDGPCAPEPATCIEAEPFALQVTDDSMAPEFPAGCVIIVDPTGRVVHGAFVIAELASGYVFRRLDLSGGKPRLEALDPAAPALDLPGGLADLRGVVVQRAGRRRRDRKRYD